MIGGFMRYYVLNRNAQPGSRDNEVHSKLFGQDDQSSPLARMPGKRDTCIVA